MQFDYTNRIKYAAQDHLVINCVNILALKKTIQKIQIIIITKDESYFKSGFCF